MVVFFLGNIIKRGRDSFWLFSFFKNVQHQIVMSDIMNFIVKKVVGKCVFFCFLTSFRVIIESNIIIIILTTIPFIFYIIIMIENSIPLIILL